MTPEEAMGDCLRLRTMCAALMLSGFVNVALAQGAGLQAKPSQAIPVQAFVPTAPIVFRDSGSGLSLSFRA